MSHPFRQCNNPHDTGQHWRIYRTAHLLHDELVIDGNDVYPSDALGLERLVVVNVSWDLSAARSSKRSRDADLFVDSIRVVVPLSWTVSARSGDVSFTFKGGSVFSGWVWPELRREAVVESAVCAAHGCEKMSERVTRLKMFGY